MLFELLQGQNDILSARQSRLASITVRPFHVLGSCETIRRYSRSEVGAACNSLWRAHCEMVLKVHISSFLFYCSEIQREQRANERRRTLFVSSAGLEHAKQLVTSYKKGEIKSMTPELWQAKKVIDSTLHPGT